MNDGSIIIYDLLPIARVMSKAHPLFLGASEADQHQCNMWLDLINSTVLPSAKRVIAQCNGLNKPQMDLKMFSMASADLKQALSGFEAHLKLRNFLVGHSLTLADVALVGILANAFNCAVDKKTRDNTLPNVQRFVNLIMQMPTFVQIYGQVTFCKDASFVPLEQK